MDSARTWTMSAKELDRLEVLGRVIERRLTPGPTRFGLRRTMPRPLSVPYGASRVAPIPLCTHADAHTPAEPLSAVSNCYGCCGGSRRDAATSGYGVAARLRRR